MPTPEEQRARLQAIRKLVEENNQSCLSTEMIVCQIYMESRFDKLRPGRGQQRARPDAAAEGGEPRAVPAR
jgi:hypothetical protein